MNTTIPFGPADILLPKTGFEKWACIACDQFTSQPDYWEKAYELAGDAPSCLHIVLPEVYLETGGSEGKVEAINMNMSRYLSEGIFKEYKNSMILTERVLSNGKCRRGIIGAFALDEYSYEQGTKPYIRPTEGTVLSRIPPRVEIRKDAPLELPHIMVLMDDKKREIVEGIDTSRLQLLYDFELMLGGGRIRGWLIDEKEQRRIMTGLTRMMEAVSAPDDRLLFAVGDGNHSLASAKAASELIGTAESRWALAELVNIHDEAVDFEPIFRVVFDVDVPRFIQELHAAFPDTQGRRVEYMGLDLSGSIFLNGLEAELLQGFIDRYIELNPGTRLDYIHGEAAVRELSAQKNAVGFIFGGIEKDQLFDYVRRKGIFPRKTFSIGHAEDKRYYMEARRIR